MKFKLITIICFLIIAVVYSCESDSDIEFKQYYSSGAVVYQQHCQNCHGDKGQGLAALIPPIVNISSLKSFHSTLPCIMQSGLKGKLIVAGKAYDGQMPPSGLTPIEIGQIITYITNSFGSHSGVFTGEMVNASLAKCGLQSSL